MDVKYDAILGELREADTSVVTVGNVTFKGTKATVADLPASGNTQGDMWRISADGSEYYWTGSAWDLFGSPADKITSGQCEIDADGTIKRPGVWTMTSFTKDDTVVTFTGDTTTPAPYYDWNERKWFLAPAGTFSISYDDGTYTMTGANCAKAYSTDSPAATTVNFIMDKDPAGTGTVVIGTAVGAAASTSSGTLPILPSGYGDTMPQGTLIQMGADGKLAAALDMQCAVTGQFVRKIASGYDTASVDVPSYPVAECTELGIVLGTTSVQIAWEDPDDVVFNGVTIATWQRTVAVAKQNSFPTSVTDGTIIAATSRTPSTDSYPLPTGVSYGYKDAYKETSATCTVEDGNTVCVKLFSCTTANTWNALSANEYPTYTSYSWAQLANYADAGTFLQHVPVGSALDMEHGDFAGHQWLVIDSDLFHRQNQAGGHTVALLSRYVLFTDCADYTEVQYSLTEDSAAVTGVTYALNIGGTITAMTEGTDWTAGDTSVTKDGVVYSIAQWLEKNPNTTKNYTPQRNDIQWMNSSADANNWFEKQNIWDQVSSTLKARPGFLKNLPASFVNCLVPCTRTCYNHTTYRIRGIGESGTFTARVFPLNIKEAFDQSNGGVQEGLRKCTYFDSASTLVATQLGSASACAWWLGSASSGYANFVLCVTSSGSSTNYFALNAFGFRPACAFGKQVSE